MRGESGTIGKQPVRTFQMVAKIINKLRRGIELIRSGEVRYWWWQRKLARLHLDFSRVSVEDLGLDPARSEAHQASPQRFLAKVVDSFKLHSGDAILDVGCGKGAALFVFSRRFSRMGGVEIHQGMLETARTNLKRGGISNCDLWCCDAATFQEYDGFNWIFLFNPFPNVVLEQVITNLVASARRKSRKIILLHGNYKNPGSHESLVCHGFREIACHEAGEVKLRIYLWKVFE